MEQLIQTRKGPLRTADVLNSIAKRVRQLSEPEPRPGERGIVPMGEKAHRLAQQIESLASSLDAAGKRNVNDESAS